MDKNITIYLKLKDLRHTTKLSQMAQGLSVDCGFDYSKKRDNAESIPWIIKQVCEANGIDIAILDINHLPAFCSTNDVDLV